MDAIVHPSPVSGVVHAPASKSEAHRALICAALSQAPTHVVCESTNDDIDATAGALSSLGARISFTGSGFDVEPVAAGDLSGQEVQIDVGESGSTLRFLLPVIAALGARARVVLHGRLPERPMGELVAQLEEKGVRVEGLGTSCLAVTGRLSGGVFALPGNVSSQYASGILLAAPLLEEDVELRIGEPVQSRPYLDMTIDALALCSVAVEASRATLAGEKTLVLRVGADSSYRAPEILACAGDWSNAAFWLAAGALGEGVQVQGVDPASTQGDRAVLGALALMGARVSRGDGFVACANDSLRGAALDMRDIPDLLPPLAAVAACAKGQTRFFGAERLRLKESDRLQSVSQALMAVGAQVQASVDGLIVEGAERLDGGIVDACGDHRIAMMAGILAARCEGPVRITGAQCVSKSYPAFFSHLGSLGATIEYDEEA